ncbi:MAG: glycosyltransferase family 4 protein [Acidimicrobiales bacterium]|nr:glycosyltransferase family 4 protein [Acidimicrobiales bacterium]
MTTIAHLTSVHRRNDTRVFLKECRSLAEAGYDVVLLVADGRGDDRVDGVRVQDVGRGSGVRGRLGASIRILRAARQLDAAVFHLHDPELLPLGWVLRRGGRTVVFDAHEDLPAQLISKPYLGPRRRRALAFAMLRLERSVCGRLDAVIAATPAIGCKFAAINPKTVIVNNYPVVDELSWGPAAGSDRASVCYVGEISAIRGIRELVQAMEYVEPGIDLLLVGTFENTRLQAEVEAMPGWVRVRAHGFQPRDAVRELLGQSFAGLVTFHPAPNHLEAQPNKMFEYMSAGVAVIASNFPAWRQAVEETGSGVCVDPMDPVAIAAAINDLAADHDRATAMGTSGRRLVETTHNWRVEVQALLRLYRELAEPG